MRTSKTAIFIRATVIVFVIYMMMATMWNLMPTTLRLSRSQLERIVEDAVFLLQSAPSLNTEDVLAESALRTDVSTLPALYDPPHDFDSPLDGDSKDT